MGGYRNARNPNPANDWYDVIPVEREYDPFRNRLPQHIKDLYDRLDDSLNRFHRAQYALDKVKDTEPAFWVTKARICSPKVTESDDLVDGFRSLLRILHEGGLAGSWLAMKRDDFMKWASISSGASDGVEATLKLQLASASSFGNIFRLLDRSVPSEARFALARAPAVHVTGGKNTLAFVADDMRFANAVYSADELIRHVSGAILG